MPEDPEPPSSGEITALLLDWNNPASRERLLSVIYPELRRIAAARMRGERAGHTLQPTALVSEAFLQLAKAEGLNWRNRAHFFAVASEAMRRILIDHARQRLAQKRGGGAVVNSLDSQPILSLDHFQEWVEIDSLLDELESRNERVATVFKLHCFVGLTFEQVGEALGIHSRTAKRDYGMARAWLYAALQQSKNPE